MPVQYNRFQSHIFVYVYHYFGSIHSLNTLFCARFLIPLCFSNCPLSNLSLYLIFLSIDITYEEKVSLFFCKICPFFCLFKILLKIALNPAWSVSPLQVRITAVFEQFSILNDYFFLNSLQSL